MVDINLSAVNVTDVKSKFVDVVSKVITTKTPAPPTRPSKKGDEEDDEDDDDDGRPNTKRPNSTPQPTPTYVYTFTMTPPPRTTGAVTPSPAPLIYTISASPSPSPAPTTQRPANTSTLSVSSSPPASTAITKTGAKAKSGSGIAIVISVAVVFCLAVVAIAVFVVRRRQSKMDARGKSLSSTHSGQGRTASSSRFVGTANATMDDVTTNYSHMTTTTGALFRDKRLQTSSSMADHPEITAVRIPLEKIEFHDLLSRGGFGEVHRGLYKGQQVAIKRLLPERRKDLRQIDAFLAEAKMMGTLEHERIVHFVGVAWDSLSELCVVTEYMEGGDLRSVLSRWETDKHREQGFDHDKIKIALHVAHAMTYLHSMQPVILHRDLKSKNILLTHDLDAKLTDFGVSRERSDATMTAGVGSSLWMAPEVMMGERYDDKADVFSFGVVLSELDTHLLPYAHAAEPGTGRKIPDTAILQMVALGKIEVAFTPNADPEMVALGRDCVSLDPTKRPTAGEALHRVHKLWRSCAVTL